MDSQAQRFGNPRSQNQSGLVLHKEKHLTALCCLVFAPTFNSTAPKELIPRIGYLNERSSRAVHFYCAGYGAWLLPDRVTDQEEVGVVRYPDEVIIPWVFSPMLFAQFVTELEQATKWTYNGGTQIILMDATADFRDCIVFDVEKMIKDSAVSGAGALFEQIIRFGRSKTYPKTPTRLSDGTLPKIIGQTVIDVLIGSLPSSMRGTWKSGLHYITRDLRRNQ